MDEKTKVLEELCEIITQHLRESTDRLKRGGDMSMADIDIIDKLTHSLKCIKTTLAMMESEGGESRRSYDGGNSMRRSYADEYSNRRGRDSMGRYVSRDGGYSSHDGIEDIMMDIRDMPESERRKLKSMGAVVVISVSIGCTVFPRTRSRTIFAAVKRSAGFASGSFSISMTAWTAPGNASRSIFRPSLDCFGRPPGLPDTPGENGLPLIVYHSPLILRCSQRPTLCTVPSRHPGAW